MRSVSIADGRMFTYGKSSGNGRVYYHPLTEYMKCKGSLSERFEYNPDFELQFVLCQVCKLGSEIKQPDRGARSSNKVVELECLQ